MNKPKILVITPVKHIQGVSIALESIGCVSYLEDPAVDEVINEIEPYDAILTNPNKSKVYLGKEILDSAKNLKVICTASTGTNHIDKLYAKEKGIAILSLTEERHIISRISSTAELAFALTLAGLRQIIPSHNMALDGEWDYTKYIGRQMNCLTIGVVGYGRLGYMYSNFCKAFGSKIMIYDPYKIVEDSSFQQTNDLGEILAESDVVSFHVHVNNETHNMLNAETLTKANKKILIVNSSRGDIINELDLVEFLKNNPDAKVATDVLADEVRNRSISPLLEYAKVSNQVTITQHIGGMTKEAQEIAYLHAITMLQTFFEMLQT